MSEVELQPATGEVAIPAELPVLPLKETVVFPESMTPLAIGQERSIKLIDDVVAGERLLALVAVKNEETESPGFDDPREPERWNPSLKLVKEILLTREPEVAEFPLTLRLVTRLAAHSAALSRRGTTVLHYRF